jgi:hypothetical protein
VYQRITHTAEDLRHARRCRSLSRMLCARERPSLTKRKSLGVGLRAGQPNENTYSLRPILLFANTDVSITGIYLDTSILAKSIMDRREYRNFVCTKV